jgi:hypothetical protein
MGLESTKHICRPHGDFGCLDGEENARSHVALGPEFVKYVCPFVTFLDGQAKGT